MKVSWRDVGKPTEPTQIKLGDYILTVEQDAIDTWSKFPTARFRLLLTEEMDGKFAALGAFEVPED